MRIFALLMRAHNIAARARNIIKGICIYIRAREKERCCWRARNNNNASFFTLITLVYTYKLTSAHKRCVYYIIHILCAQGVRAKST